MNIGSLYKVKKYFWLLFPTKETASEVAHAHAHVFAAAASGTAAAGVLPPVFGVAVEQRLAATTAAPWYSKRYNCEVTYFSPDSYIVFLEEDGELKRVLTADGKIGWIWFTENYNDYFEEVKAKS